MRDKTKSLANKMEDKINKLKFEIESKENKKEKIYEDRLNDVIDLEVYKKLSNKFDEEINILKNELNNLETSYNNYMNEHGDKQIEEAAKIAKEYLKKKKETN